MNITYEKFCEIFAVMFDNDKRGSAYLQTVPTDIRSAVFDNGYVDSLNNTISKLCDVVFEPYVETVYWMLYEWKPGAAVIEGEKLYVINDLSDFFNYTKEVMKFVKD